MTKQWESLSRGHCVLCLLNHHKGGDLQRPALVVCRVGEGHGAVVICAWCCGEQGDMVDSSNRFVDVASAFTPEVEGPGPGGAAEEVPGFPFGFR